MLRRWQFSALAVTTIGVGLAVHFHGHALGDVARDVIGDALWSMMMAWWVGALVPERTSLARGAIALAISFTVELSQLIHTSTLDALRGTTLGHLVLGSGFDLRDLFSYACGVGVALLIERAISRRAR